MMDDDFIPDARTEEEKQASVLYWLTKTPEERTAEGWRLSVEKYGLPVGDLRDGSVLKYRINPDGTRTFISETSGPNPLRRI
jgi:hypothetical protein